MSQNITQITALPHTLYVVHFAGIHGADPKDEKSYWVEECWLVGLVHREDHGDVFSTVELLQMPGGTACFESTADDDTFVSWFTSPDAAENEIQRKLDVAKGLRKEGTP